MADNADALLQQDEGSSNLFVSVVNEPAMSSVSGDLESDTIQGSGDSLSPCNCCDGFSCTSAKRYRKYRTDTTVVNYTWNQTVSDIVITVHLSEEQASALQVDLTSTAIVIQLSADKTKVIHLHKIIDRDKSRVQVKKQASDTLLLIHIVKQCQEFWKQLEASKEEKENVWDGGAGVGSWQFIKDQKVCGTDICMMANRNGLADGCEIGDTVVSSEISEEQKVDSDSEIMKKEEEPVYNLVCIKNDFFEKQELVLILHVYVKRVKKDAAVIHFNKQGFVLKFHTEDAKFLQLYEGTTKDTTFLWTVTTRKEIVPDKCEFKVKDSVIEILLHKTSQEKWTSLEAPTRKETANSSDTHRWIPMSKPSQPVTSASLSSAASTVRAAEQACAKTSSDEIFGDLSDIGLSDREYNNSKAVPTSSYSYQSDEANYKVRASASQDLNKPTAKVHPLNSHISETGNIIPPGFAGLVNLGNTCFMNCVLQVLANTREFRDYFLDGRFQHEINEDNPLGMRGQLAATFGALMRWLWSCKKHCWEPRKLKELISKKNPQFFGYAQHDAHEFLAFLLDGLHEDLNRIRKKPYTETIDSDGRPDEVVAAEAWAQYKQRNDSVVVDLFQGQYKSKLVCPKCEKVSITFDPFLYLSVPLPKKKKTIIVTFLWKESYRKPVRYQIQVSQDSTVEMLMEELSVRTKVRASDMRVFEAYKSRIRKFFNAGARLDNVEPKDTIVACEVLSEELAGEKVLEIIVMQRTMHPTEYPGCCAFCHKLCSDGVLLKRCTKCFKVGYCDRTCQRSHWSLHKSQCSSAPEPIGCPFILSLPCSRATYGYLVKHMEEFSRFSVDVFQPPVKSSEGGGSASSSTTATITTNLDNSLSQSSSSLNSLDSLSSASSTCTLTGNQSDPNNLDLGDECGDGVPPNQSDLEASVSASGSSSLLPVSPSSPQTTCSSDGQMFSEISGATWLGSSDSGFQSLDLREKVVPMSQVMGVQVVETDRDKATPTFYIKPVTIEGVGNAERLEDKGDQPLDLVNRRILSMDWRNNAKQPFYVLVRSKELEAEEANDLNNMAASCGNKPSLHHCLELFTKPEILSPEEAWYCPACKKHVEASKQMTIWRLPHTLIIQLKRFSFQNFLMRAKVKKHVDFPTRGLDMSYYCVGLKAGEARPIYDLFGVVNHHGLLIGGHYTSYVRCCGDNSQSDEVGWRLCDDSRVNAVTNEKSVVNSDAYLLFYRRRGHKAIIGPQCDAARLSAHSYQDLDASTQALSATDSNVTYSSLEDERNGNIQESQDTALRSSVLVGHSHRTDLSREHTLDNENMNVQNISRGKMIPYRGQKLIISQYEERSMTDNDGQELEEEDMREKGDEEKIFLDCGGGDKEVPCNDDDYDTNMSGDEDYDSEGRNLIIDTQTDLGYTDMEAVD